DRYGDISPVCMRGLNTIVAQTGAQIVITSTWRYGKTIPELRQALAEHGFAGRVIGTTPRDMPGTDRGEQIAAWLAEHPVDSYVIIDDHRDVGPLIGHLVQTNPLRG